MNSSAGASAGAPANEQRGYALWAVLRRDPSHPAKAVGDSTGELAADASRVEAAGVTIRGWCDVCRSGCCENVRLGFKPALAGVAP